MRTRWLALFDTATSDGVAPVAPQSAQTDETRKRPSKRVARRPPIVDDDDDEIAPREVRRTKKPRR